MEEPEIAVKCQANADYMRKKFTDNGFNIGVTTTCVVPVIFRDTMQCINMHKWLLDNGYFSAIVMAPACPVDAPRFRLCATTDMTFELIDDIVKTFMRAREEVKENLELREIFE